MNSMRALELVSGKPAGYESQSSARALLPGDSTIRRNTSSTFNGYPQRSSNNHIPRVQYNQPPYERLQLPMTTPSSLSRSPSPYSTTSGHSPACEIFVEPSSTREVVGTPMTADPRYYFLSNFPSTVSYDASNNELQRLSAVPSSSSLETPQPPDYYRSSPSMGNSFIYSDKVATHGRKARHGV